MKRADSNFYNRYDDLYLRKAQTLLKQKDLEDPMWMSQNVPCKKKQSWLLGEEFFQNFLAPAVCGAVIVCLLISASTTRLTAKALSVAIQNDMQQEFTMSDR